MLHEFIENKITQRLNIRPTEQQKELIFKLSKFITSKKSNIFLLKGYAGTGKTTIISATVNTLSELGTDTILLAPTGRAAKVFSNTANTPAYTIHKKIFRAQSKTKLFSKFNLDQNTHNDAIFLIDEASMISNKLDNKNTFGSGKLLDDLIKYVFSGKRCKIILSGDTAQLPPVGLTISPALNKNTLELYNKNVEQYELTQVVRQSLNSGILHNATKIRQIIAKNEIHTFPKFNIDNFDDIIRISGSDLIECISDSYNSIGTENTIIITQSNKRANKYNQGIRNTILYREENFAKEDLVMIVKNNYFWKDNDKNIDFIANGDIATIAKIRTHEKIYDHNFINAELFFADLDTFVDAKILTETINSEAPALTYEQYHELFDKIAETYENEKNRKKRLEKILLDEHLNALQIKFAYAVTCHKAQGGQWNTVFIDQPYINKNRLNIDFYRWLYTAVTRATNKIYLVNFNDDFFE